MVNKIYEPEAAMGDKGKVLLIANVISQHRPSFAANTAFFLLLIEQNLYFVQLCISPETSSPLEIFYNYITQHILWKVFSMGVSSNTDFSETGRFLSLLRRFTRPSA